MPQKLVFRGDIMSDACDVAEYGASSQRVAEEKKNRAKSLRDKRLKNTREANGTAQRSKRHEQFSRPRITPRTAIRLTHGPAMQECVTPDDLAVEDQGRTLLQRAVKSENLDLVRRLVEVKVDMNKSSFSEPDLSPFHEACRSGNPDIVKCLLDSGAAVEAAAASGIFPLMMAVAVSGSDDELKMDGPAKQGREAETSNAHVVKHLIGAKADVNRRYGSGKGVTPLFVAAKNGDGATCQQLLQAGARPNSKMGNGSTALTVAARHGHLGAVRALVEAKADVNLKTAYEGETPLFVAAENGKIEIVEYLLQLKGIHIDRADDDGFTPLHAALCAYHNIESCDTPGLAGLEKENILQVIGRLAKAGADVDQVSPVEQTSPVETAVQKADIKLLEVRAVLRV